MTISVVCPNCNTQTNVLHGNKVRCPCGVTYGFDRGTRETTVVTTIKPVKGKQTVVDLEVADGLHPLHTERLRTMFNFTSPDEKTVEYYIEERDDGFIIFSKAYPISKDGRGVAHNYVAEKPTREEAEELLDRLKRL